MSMLLTKRLMRSLMRTKLRLAAVVFMVAVSVFAGLSFTAYAHAAINMYTDIYEDDADGVNLPDIWVENQESTWNGTLGDELCQKILSNWTSADLKVKRCEPRFVYENALLAHNSTGGVLNFVPSTLHGIDEGYIDRVWLPTDDDCCKGRLPSDDSEIVIDARAADLFGGEYDSCEEKGDAYACRLSNWSSDKIVQETKCNKNSASKMWYCQVQLGETLTLSASMGPKEFSVVGIGFHSNHIFYAREGEIVPVSSPVFFTGYMTAEGLETLRGVPEGTSNLLLIDIEGDPEFDFPETDLVEGESLTNVMSQIRSTMLSETDDPTLVYDRSGMYFIELLRQDVAGAQKITPYITGMIGLVAGITIFLSLQRLIQSQAKEIAVLRTLGTPRTSIMPGYIIAPMIIGFVGCIIGVILGFFVGAPGMTNFYTGYMGLPNREFSIPPSDLIYLVATVMIIVVLSGILPAWKAAKLQPLEVLSGRHEVRMASKRLQKITAGLPATAGLTIRSSVRKPVRLLVTFTGVGISMLLFGTMIIMMDSFGDLFLGSNGNWDARMQVSDGDEDAIIAWANRNNTTHELVLESVAFTIEDTPRPMAVIGLDQFNRATDPNGLFRVSLKSGELPVSGAPTPEVLVDEGIAHFLKWDVGQVQRLTFGTNDMEVKVVGITNGELSRTVYFHRSDLLDVLPNRVSVVMLDLPENTVLPDEIVLHSGGVEYSKDSEEALAEALDTQMQFFYAILFLGAIMAIAVLFNTLIMNLSERDTELATLRVLGAPIGKLGFMLLGEHLAIGLIGGILASIFAVAGTSFLISAQLSWTLYFGVTATPRALFIITGTVLAMSAALTPYGMRRIRKMDLVEISKNLSQ